MANGIEERKGFKGHLLRWCWVLWIAQAIGLCYLIYSKMDLNDPNWETYINSWSVLAWTRISTIFGVLFALDWMYKGETIGTILYLDKDSPWQNRLVAAIFLIGISMCIVWAMRGGINV